MAFDNGVSSPGAASFAAPLLDFSEIGKLPSVFRQAGFDEQKKVANDQAQQTTRQQQQLNDQQIAQGQRQAQLAQAFPNGLPIDPKTGQVDYAKAAQVMAKFGDVSNAVTLLGQQPPPQSPMLSGGGQPAQAQPQAAPPQGAVPAQTSSSPKGDAGSGTIASIVTDRLPGQDATTGTTIGKIAQTMGLDPNANLTPGQLRRAQGLLQKYAPGDASGPSAGGQGNLPPSANAISPAPPAAAPQGGRLPLSQPQPAAVAPPAPGAQGAPIGAGSPQQPGQLVSSLPAADASLQLTTQEKALYRRHLANLTGSGGVDNHGSDPRAPEGSRSTLFVYTFGIGDKTYVIPSVSNGKILTPDEALARAKKEGIDKFPSYASEAEAKARYSAMHSFMEKDTAQFLGARGAGPGGGQPQPQQPQPQQQPGPVPQQMPPQVMPAQPQGGQPPPPQVAQAQPPQQAQAPQGQPLTPQVPLPKGFTDPQAAILALRAEAAKLSSNPRGAGQARELDNWAERIEKSIQPKEVHAGTTLLDPKTGQPIYQGNQPTMAADAINQAAERYLQTGQMPPNMGRGIQGSANSNAIQNEAAELARQRGIDIAELPGKWQQFKAQQVGIQRFTSGKQGDTVRSFNVLVDHLDTLSEAASALKNGDIRFFNEWKQKFAASRGETAPTNFDGVKALVGDEIVKAVVGSAGALADREEVKKDLDRASSPKQLSELVDRYRKLALGQLKGLRKQYETATGQKNFGDMLLPGTLAALGGNEGKGTAPDAEGWTTLPNGARIREVK